MPACLVRSCAPAALACTLFLAACGSSTSSGDTPPPPGPAATSRYALAGGCFTMADAASGRYVAAAGERYVASAAHADATPFFLKASGLGTYLLYDPDRNFLTLSDSLAAVLDAGGTVVGEVGDLVEGAGSMVDFFNPLTPAGGILDQLAAALEAAALALGGTSVAPATARGAPVSDAAEWEVQHDPASGFTLHSIVTDRPLQVDSNGAFALPEAGAPAHFRFEPATGCADYPEAQLNATGTPLAGTKADGTVSGFIDTHIHIAAHEFIGGRVNYGEPFHRFGIEHALGDCAADHGPQGTLAVVEHLTSNGNPVGTHETAGWPTYRDWPRWNSLMHHQTYHVWMKRAWMSGLRLMVNHLVGNESLCQLYPLRDNDCNEMANMRLQRERLYALQDYIDAQEGGPGRGWFRIVTTPGEARGVIGQGKLAVVLGMEFSKALDCGEFLDAPECTAEQIDQRLDEVHGLGVRALFPIHRFDNAYGGAYSGYGAISLVLDAGNTAETGHPFAFEACPDDRQPGEVGGGAGILEELVYNLQFVGSIANPPTDEFCNSRGLTPLGAHLLQGMIDRRMFIEIDHMGERARDDSLDLIEAARYPGVISGHDYLTSSNAKRRVFAAGGLVTPFNTQGPRLVERIIEHRGYLAPGHPYAFGVGFASDINGIAGQAPPRSDAAEHPLAYPFTSWDGRVTFDRQVTGARSFDLNTDGAAHYGLYADVVADMQQNGGPQAQEALEIFFNSAEAYLQMWERIEAYERPQGKK